MKRLFLWSFIIVAGYVTWRYVPAETIAAAYEKTGAKRFFSVTVPNFFRDRLSIPSSQEEKRKKLLSELTENLSDIEARLTETADIAAAATTTPAMRDAAKKSIDSAKQSLHDAGNVIAAIEKQINSGPGVFSKTASRIIDLILPPPPQPQSDAENKSICPQ